MLPSGCAAKYSPYPTIHNIASLDVGINTGLQENYKAMLKLHDFIDKTETKS